MTAVAFYTPLEGSGGPTHLLSGSADGCIAVWAVESDWDCVKTLKGHKRALHKPHWLCMHAETCSYLAPLPPWQQMWRVLNNVRKRLLSRG